MRHIHLDPLGGIAGDMFAACLLDAFPEHRPAVLAAAAALSQTECTVTPHDDGTLTGLRFTATEHHDHDHHHHHTAWRDIRARLEAATLPTPVIAHAVGIFAALADAEGRVHGRPPDDVAFHEVGAADSIADIVAAAALIHAVAPATWSVAPLPLGSGTVRTAHGTMPVPAPATALLLQGFALHDDGLPGERVTPTGAAILRYLAPAPAAPPGTLARSGTGFGTRRLPGRPNCLRALVFEAAPAPMSDHRELAVIAFEVDDQSGEDLAAGLERVRATAGVHDVVQIPAFGKKSRLAVHVQVLAAPAALEAAIAACFAETTTIGLRTHLVQGRALPRHFQQADVDGHPVTVKVAHRPGGHTAKAEADHVLALPTHAARARLRRDAEALALKTPSLKAPCMTLPRLHAVLDTIPPLAIAVSGGIDSLTLATAAHRHLAPGHVTMHHATSPAVPPEATARTAALAAAEGWTLDIFDAGEFQDPAYRANPVNRCFFCKTNLYGAIAARTPRQIASGTNTGDLSDFRPGLDAARAHAVRHPFVEAGIDKPAIRTLAAALGLGTLSELPSSPCLSSRVETGLRIEPHLLALVHAAEQRVTTRLAPRTVRCRIRARGVVIELDPDALACVDARLAATIQQLADQAGFPAPVTFAPYRTGSAFLRV